MNPTIQNYLTKRELIREYEEILVGRRKRISTFYINGNVMPLEDVAITIFRYVFDELLKWKPETAIEYFTEAIAKQLMLEPYIKMIKFPNDIDSTDLWYIVYKTYPKDIPIDIRSLTIRTYTYVLEGKKKRFPTNFFSGINEKFKAAICLNHAVNCFLHFDNLNEYYKYFAEPTGKEFIRNHYLGKVCRECFSSALEYAHMALHPEQRNEMLFEFYKYMHKIK